MVLKGEAQAWREVPHNSVSELILNNIFSNDLDICKGLIKSAPDTKLGSIINKDQVIKRARERKKGQVSFLLRKTGRF